MKEHIVAHLWFSPRLALVYSGIMATSFLLAKRSTPDSGVEASAVS